MFGLKDENGVKVIIPDGIINKVIGTNVNNQPVIQSIDDLVSDKVNISVIGISENSSNMGEYSGDILIDNQTTKDNIQILSNTLESIISNIDTIEESINTINDEIDLKSNSVAIGISSTSNDLGTFTGNFLPDNTTVKNALQVIETHTDAFETSVTNILSQKYNNPTGTISQYIRGDGSLAAYNQGMLPSNNLSDLTNQTLARTNIGLGNVNNTSDLNKPISQETQYALDNIHFLSPSDSSKNILFKNRAYDVISALDNFDEILASNIRNRTSTISDAEQTYTLLQHIFTYCSENKKTLYIPSGQYYISEQIVINKPITIIGSGDGNTTLTWTSGAISEGLSISCGGIVRPTIISDLRLETQKQTSGTAITIDYSSLIVGENIVPRAETHGRITNLTIRGSGNYVNTGWDNGINCISMMGVSIDCCRLVGRNSVYGNIPESTIGIQFGGEGKPVQLSIKSTYVSAYKTGIKIYDTEGVYIDGGCELVSVGKGIVVENQVVEPAFHFQNSHIAAVQKCIELTNAVECNISNNILYPVAPVVGDFIGIDIISGREIGIRGNQFSRPNTTTLYRGIVNRGTNTWISDNLFSVGSSNGCIAIDVLVEALNTNISINDYRAANPIIRDLSTSTSIQNSSYGFVGDLNNIYTGGRSFKQQIFTLGIGCTNMPPTITSNGCVLETLSFDTNSAIQILHTPASDRLFRRRKVSGSWGIWRYYDSIST